MTYHINSFCCYLALIAYLYYLRFFEIENFAKNQKTDKKRVNSYELTLCYIFNCSTSAY